tara:strand:- start:1787 stop:2029 length:243 start_codon:yes stop_codon:yes gene_type:complete
MTLYRTSLTVEVTDSLNLESFAVDYLQHPDQGKTPAEIQELLYEGGVFDVKKTLEVLYKPAAIYNGTTLLRIEAHDYEGE